VGTAYHMDQELGGGGWVASLPQRTLPCGTASHFKDCRRTGGRCARGFVQIEDKRELRSRLGRSPDLADALSRAAGPEARYRFGGVAVNHRWRRAPARSILALAARTGVGAHSQRLPRRDSRSV